MLYLAPDRSNAPSYVANGFEHAIIVEITFCTEKTFPDTLYQPDLLLHMCAENVLAPNESVTASATG